MLLYAMYNMRNRINLETWRDCPGTPTVAGITDRPDMALDVDRGHIAPMVMINEYYLYCE